MRDGQPSAPGIQWDGESASGRCNGPGRLLLPPAISSTDGASAREKKVRIKKSHAAAFDAAGERCGRVTEQMRSRFATETLNAQRSMADGNAEPAFAEPKRGRR